LVRSSRILLFAAIVEIGTGVVFMIDPVLVVALLLGSGLAGAGIAAGRCFGIALLALGLARWPVRQHGESESRAVKAMFVYNALVALYLGYLGIVGLATGSLLWPVVALHAAVALALAWAWRIGRRISSPGD
jgi:hypothetical protein